MQIKDKLIYNESTKSRRSYAGFLMLMLAFFLFLATLITVALLERNSTTEDTFAVANLMERLKTTFASRVNDSGEETSAFVERIQREAVNSSTRRNGKNSYYEEQSPVVVNSESIDQPEQASGETSAASSDSYDQEQYYDGGDDMYDYANSPYYQAAYQQQQQPSQGDSPEFRALNSATDEGRALNERQNDENYERWRNAATRAPMVKSTDATQRQQLPVRYMKPKPSQYGTYNYDDTEQRDNYYNYHMAQQPAYRQRPTQATPTTAPVTAAAVVENSEPTIITIFKGLKQVWDIYQALSSAWNSIYEQRQKHIEQLQRTKETKMKEVQKTRINSKKPPRIEEPKGSPQRNQTKKAKTTVSPKSETTKVSTEAPTQTSTELASAKVEPRAIVKGDKGSRHTRGLRASRDVAAAEDVGEGRYIKGDPLKGYYDFVITEGSYKFWAVFQVGTAILIIYSTFAAIYYSKVNPLVGDYDYTDYLGGGRAMTGGDLDFVDDGESSTTHPVPSQPNPSWGDWVPRTTHSLKFILDAIDKLPVDHNVNETLPDQIIDNKKM